MVDSILAEEGLFIYLSRDFEKALEHTRVFPVGAMLWRVRLGQRTDTKRTHNRNCATTRSLWILAHYDTAKLVPIPKRARNAVALDLSVKLGHNMRGDSATPPVDIRTYAKTKARA